MKPIDNSDEMWYNYLNHPEHYEMNKDGIIVGKTHEVNEMETGTITIEPASTKTEPHSEFGREKIQKALDAFSKDYPGIKIVVKDAQSLTLDDIKRTRKERVMAEWIGA